MRSLFLFFVFGVAAGSLTVIFLEKGFNKLAIGLSFMAAVCMAAIMEEKEEKELNKLWKPRK